MVLHTIVENKPRVIDLFCGAGGFSEGFRQAGFEILFGFDKCAQAVENYNHNIKQAGAICGDIKDFEPHYLLDLAGVDAEDVDIIIGGPPCQGFSLAGKMDVQDERNTLYRYYYNFVRLVSPKVFIMENVPGMVSIDNKSIYNDIMMKFKKIGYSISCHKLNAINFGVPQTRERIFFIGFLNRSANFKITPTHYYEKSNLQTKPDKNLKRFVSAGEALDDLCLEDTQGEYISNYNRETNSEYQRERRSDSIQLYNHEASRHSEEVINRFKLFREGNTIKDIPSEYRTSKMIVRRLHRSDPSPTIMTLPDDLIHYCEDRILTVREMARIQSFDDSFHFIGKRTTGGNRRKYECPQYTLVGNAVPPLLAKAIASELLGPLGNC